MRAKVGPDWVQLFVRIRLAGWPRWRRTLWQWENIPWDGIFVVCTPGRVLYHMSG